MDCEKFTALLENYYKLKYDRTEMSFIFSFFKNKIVDFKNLYFKVISEHSKKWKSLPDIYIFNLCMAESESKIEIMAETEWQSLLKISGSFDVVINNHITAFVIAGYGSWVNFCRERDDNREWTHKTFLKRWAGAYSEGIDYTPQKLAGEFTAIGCPLKNQKPLSIGVAIKPVIEYSENQDIQKLAELSFQVIE